jgi:hypothetical protein
MQCDEQNKISLAYVLKNFEINLICFIFTIDQELWTCEIMLVLSVTTTLWTLIFLNQLNLLYIYIYLYLQQIQNYEHTD